MLYIKCVWTSGTQDSSQLIGCSLYSYHCQRNGILPTVEITELFRWSRPLNDCVCVCILLVSHGSKIFLSVIIIRIRNKAECEITEEQARFHPCCGTRDQTVNLQIVTENKLTNRDRKCNRV